jgi:hypothetical protein
MENTFKEYLDHADVVKMDYLVTKLELKEDRSFEEIIILLSSIVIE